MSFFLFTFVPSNQPNCFTIMKKIFSFALCAAAALTASAQVIISPTGMMDEIGMQAEGMSPDASSYVAGSNQLSSQPAIWNVATDEVWEFGGADTVYQPIYGQKPGWEYVYDEVNWWEIVDSVPTMVEDYDNIIGYDSTLWDLNTYGGTFHAINNSGLAVGTFGGSYSEKFPAKANFGDAEVTYLYAEDGVDFGGDAWAVNADGSLILGFYYDGAWVTHACLWKNGGLTAADRIDLPAPDAEEFGGDIDYVSARWMSEDASVILGYAQDAVNGKWVMIYWTLNPDGSYTVHGNYAKQNFTPHEYDEQMVGSYLHPERPYAEFEPQALSANGEWATLIVKPQYDLNDWFAAEINQAARLNLKSGKFEVLDLGEFDGPIMYGIANNGTAVGATEAGGGVGPMSTLGESLTTARTGYVWFTGSDTIVSLQELFPTEEYFNYEEGLGEAAISSISADATKIVGYTNQTDGVETWVTSSFIATLPVTAVENTIVTDKAVKTIENGQLIILRDGAKYNALGIKF